MPNDKLIRRVRLTEGTVIHYGKKAKPPPPPAPPKGAAQQKGK